MSGALLAQEHSRKELGQRLAHKRAMQPARLRTERKKSSNAIDT